MASRENELLIVTPEMDGFSSASEYLNKIVLSQSHRLIRAIGMGRADMSGPTELGFDPTRTKFFPDGLVSGTTFKPGDVKKLLAGREDRCEGWISAVMYNLSFHIYYEFTAEAAKRKLRLIEHLLR